MKEEMFAHSTSIFCGLTICYALLRLWEYNAEEDGILVFMKLHSLVGETDNNK